MTRVVPLAPPSPEALLDVGAQVEAEPDVLGVAALCDSETDVDIDVGGGPRLEDVGGPAEEDGEVVIIEGAMVTKKPRRFRPSFGYEAARWEIRSCPHHGDGCFRSRSVELDRDTFGDDGVRYYLGAWLRRGGDLTMAEHRAFRPTRDEVAAYVLSMDAAADP